MRMPRIANTISLSSRARLGAGLVGVWMLGMAGCESQSTPFGVRFTAQPTAEPSPPSPRVSTPEPQPSGEARLVMPSDDDPFAPPRVQAGGLTAGLMGVMEVPEPLDADADDGAGGELNQLSRNLGNLERALDELMLAMDRLSDHLMTTRLMGPASEPESQQGRAEAVRPR